MSVNHSSFLGIGRRMYSIAEVETFLLAKTKLTEEDIKEIRKCCYEGEEYVEITCLDHYNEDDWFVGFSVGKTQEPNKIEDCVASAKNAWEEMFPNEPARVVWAVIYS
jgi:long-subunit fatty acid transport protein